jgi:photosynthetic reaction center cytochrome c subunit
MKFMVPIIVCVLSLGVVFGQAAQEPKPVLADTVFKNIPALKGIPVDEFMDTMGMFSAALNMNCTDCHTKDSLEDWANFAKETPLKVTARRMTLMVNGINKNNFGGKQMVTCYTCHHGDQKAKQAPSLTIQYSVPFDDPNEVQIPVNGFPNAPLADEVFDKYIRAVGGQSKVTALKSFIAKGKYQGYDTQHADAQIEVYAKAPAQRTSVIHASFGDKITVFNGRDGWFSSADRPAPLISLTGGNLEGARLDAMSAFPTQIKQMARQWRVGITAIDEKDVVVLQGTNGNLRPVNLYFDQSSGLLVRMTRFADTLVGPVPTQIDFLDYRDVAGVKVPFRWITTWTDNQTITQFSDIQPNPVIDDARFAKPAPAK